MTKPSVAQGLTFGRIALGSAPRLSASITGLPASLAALLLAWAALTWPWLSGDVTIPWDAKLHFQAQLQFLADSLDRGQSPAWNPFAFSGWPQIADPQSLIFSPYFPLALLSDDPGFQAADMVALLSLLAAGLGTLLFIRDRGWGCMAGLSAAIIVMIGGSASARLQHVTQVISFAALCVALWATARMIEHRSYRWGIAAGVAVALMVVDPNQVAYLGVLFLVAFVLHSILASPDRRATLRTVAGPALAAAGVTVVIVAIPLLLTLSLLAASSRPGIDFSVAGTGSLHPAFLWTTVVPDLFGSLGPAAGYIGPGSEGWKDGTVWIDRSMGQIYFGIIPILLILVHGIAGGQLFGRAPRFFVGATIALLLYALGWWTPVFGWVYGLVPGVDLFRRPADATFLLGLTVAILTGYLISRLLADGPPRMGVRQVALAIGLLAAVFGSAVVVGWSDLGPSALDAGDAAMLVAILAAVGIVAAGRLARISVGVAGLALAAGIALDLATVNGPNEMNAGMPGDYRVLDPDKTNPVLAFLEDAVAESATPTRRDRVELNGLDGPWQNAAMVHRLENTLAYNPLRIATYEKATGADQNSDDATGRVFTPLFPSYDSTLADLLGLRWIATPVPIETVDRRLRPDALRLAAQFGDVRIYENPDTFPRAMLVPTWRRADFNRLLADGNWGGTDLSRTVLLADTPPDPVPAGITNAAPGTVSIRRYRNTKVTIDVDAPSGGFLVLNDLWHPWWRATIDGREVPVLRANVLFRAVALPPGAHTVRFRFEPIGGLFGDLMRRL